MKLRIKITLVFPEIGSRIADMLIKALGPDNVNAPNSIHIDNIVEKESLKIVIEYIDGPKGVLTLRNTVDDLLEHLNLVLKVLESVKDN